MTPHLAIAESLAAVLGADCRSVILHGSLAAGGFRPGSSDIDLLAIVDRPITDEQTERIITLVRHADLGDAAGLDLDVVTVDATRSPIPAPPLELHVGRYPPDPQPNDVATDADPQTLADDRRRTEPGVDTINANQSPTPARPLKVHAGRYPADPEPNDVTTDATPTAPDDERHPTEPGAVVAGANSTAFDVDRYPAEPAAGGAVRPPAEPELEVERRLPAATDLLAELSMARQDGLALVGAAPAGLIGPIPPEWVVARGRHWLRTWQGLTDDAPNAAFMVLTACRIWHFAAEHVHSPKVAAARWALSQEPSLTAIGQALRRYGGDATAIVDEPGIAAVLAEALRRTT
ncbi:DUF4111 domain-containing protein [Actinoplanes sp. TRM 88003]|uniref:DUF4111 domain-containing protein n=1 Tax=Paractinoplanes aksuensis TaxID=2939490 RepID=A0ABT1DF62_9ACTN|nr:aminoglycoside adenylyltransferase domain-containing protein [Actinoplanes aksuensis]MCO8269449.1 DUF4111 domain-containing protein [Actinoplanes aksuensis]